MQLSPYINGFIIRKPLTHSKSTEMSPLFIEDEPAIHQKQATGVDFLKSRTCLYYIRRGKRLMFLVVFNTCFLRIDQNNQVKIKDYIWGQMGIFLLFSIPQWDREWVKREDRTRLFSATKLDCLNGLNQQWTKSQNTPPCPILIKICTFVSVIFLSFVMVEY